MAEFCSRLDPPLAQTGGHLSCPSLAVVYVQFMTSARRSLFDLSETYSSMGARNAAPGKFSGRCSGLFRRPVSKRTKESSAFASSVLTRSGGLGSALD